MSSKISWLNKWAKNKQRGDINEYNEGRLFGKFSLLAMNRFKWENLPPGIESRHIERFLFENGQVGFYKDPLIGYVCLPCSSNGNLNLYGDATGYNLVGTGYSESVDSKEMVRILCNDLALPNKLEVAHYTTIIDELEKSSFMNTKQQRFPWLIGTTKENELSLKNLFKKVDEGEEQIFIDTRLSQGGTLATQTISTNTPYVVDKLRQEKQEVENELLSWLGLNNTSTNKKERLLVDEVNVNNNHILMNIDIEYKNRQLACDLINEKFGLDITVIKTIDELQVDFQGQLLDDNENDDDKKKGWFK